MQCLIRIGAMSLSRFYVIITTSKNICLFNHAALGKSIFLLKYIVTVTATGVITILIIHTLGSCMRFYYIVCKLMGVWVSYLQSIVIQDKRYMLTVDSVNIELCAEFSYISFLFILATFPKISYFMRWCLICLFILQVYQPLVVRIGWKGMHWTGYLNLE